VRRRDRNIFEITNEFGGDDGLLAGGVEQPVDLFAPTEVPIHNGNGGPRDGLRSAGAPSVPTDRRSRFALIACGALVACALLVGLTPAGKQGTTSAPDSLLGPSKPNAVQAPHHLRPKRPHKAASPRSPSRTLGGVQVPTPRAEPISRRRQAPVLPSGTPAALRQVEPRPSARPADPPGHEFSFER
jgi:hypothetical protein